jgi:hypothetical protein
MRYDISVTEAIEQRFSCRTYNPRPIERETQQALEAFIANAEAPPFRTPTRFRLVAATEADSQELKGLGTYGFIQGASGFLVGAVEGGSKNMEDYGWQLEDLILFATSLDLGTCWLGGTFTKSSFAERIDLRDDEIMPAVVSIGYIAERRSLRERLIRLGAGSHRRLPWERLFFDGQFGVPLTREAAGPVAVPLEMVRLGPSASNKQPWRVVRQASAWHLYLQRTPGYGRGISSPATTADLQRVDMGIAMAHFEFTARESGLEGGWRVEDPGILPADEYTEYVATWV